MTKDEVVDLMLNSINDDTRMMCVQFGMSPEETDNKIAESQNSLYFLLSNVYDKMKESNIL